MLNLFRGELYKLLHGRALWVCAMLCVVMTAIVCATYGMLEEAMMDMPPEAAAQMEKMGMSIGSGGNALLSDSLDGGWMLANAYNGNTMQSLLAIFVSIFVVAEFSSGAMKVIASKGLGRTQIYLAKLLAVAAATFILSIVIALASLIGGVLVGGAGELQVTVWQLVRFLGIQFLLNFALASFFMMIAMLFRTYAAAISVNLCLLFFFPMVLSFITVLAGTQIEVPQFWLLQGVESMSTFTPDAGDVANSLVLSAVYLSAATAVGCFAFHKQDIK